MEKEEFFYDEYKVILTLKGGSTVEIYENSDGVFVNDTCIASSKLNLPTFEEYKYSKQLRILHHEILISFYGILPVPNIFVYHKPWYRDGAMMGLVLEKTGNIELLRPWAMSVTELYDRNNWNMCEPDNLGQLAFILSFFTDKSYPLTGKIIEEAKRISVDGCLTGITDGNDHSVYSTLWLKYGLARLGADTDFIKIPKRFPEVLPHDPISVKVNGKLVRTVPRWRVTHLASHPWAHVLSSDTSGAEFHHLGT